jgi:hypothetical protein
LHLGGDREGSSTDQRFDLIFIDTQSLDILGQQSDPIERRSGTHCAAIRIPLMESGQELLRPRLARLKELKRRTTDPAAATAINDEIGDVETRLQVRDELALEIGDDPQTKVAALRAVTDPLRP